METTWAVQTHGNPLGAVTGLMESIWQETRLEGMFISADGLEEHTEPHYLLEQPGQLQKFNPFRPAMTANAARYVPEMLRENPAGKYGAILRPCEIRTLRQLEALDPFERERLVTICVDCLGTFPADDVQWRTERKGSADDLAGDTLKFARQGGISADRYRPACQVCRSASAEGADVNIWVTGLPARQFILLNTSLEAFSEAARSNGFAPAKASPDQLEMRQRVVNRVATRNQAAQERFVQELVNTIPASIEAIAEHLEKCGECRKCLDACPICAASNFKRDEHGHYNRYEIAQWLSSCAGCGMCEQACVKNIPLSAIFAAVREQVLSL